MTAGTEHFYKTRHTWCCWSISSTSALGFNTVERVGLKFQNAQKRPKHRNALKPSWRRYITLRYIRIPLALTVSLCSRYRLAYYIKLKVSKTILVSSNMNAFFSKRICYSARKRRKKTGRQLGYFMPKCRCDILCLDLCAGIIILIYMLCFVFPFRPFFQMSGVSLFFNLT